MSEHTPTSDTGAAPETEALAKAVCDSKHGGYVTACFSCRGWAEYASEWLATRDAAQRAAGWDEGYDARGRDIANEGLTEKTLTPNPYEPGAQC